MNNKSYAFVKSNKKFIKLLFSEVQIIKGLGNYVEIYTISNKRYVYYKTLKDLIEDLPGEFMRLHNSYIVNLSNIDYFEDNQVNIGEHKISFAKSYRAC
jgi:DNA-binding LytR/AlgR family response regulator